jgi:hypothetical protein
MNLVAVLLLLASADPSGAATTSDAATEASPKAERKICKRIDATESRMLSKRVCKTAKEWRAAENDSNAAAIDRLKKGLSDQ